MIQNIKILFNKFEKFDKGKFNKEYLELYNELSNIFNILFTSNNIPIDKKSELRKETIELARKIYIFLCQNMDSYTRELEIKTKRLQLMTYVANKIILARVFLIPIIFLNTSLFLILTIILSIFNLYLSSPKRFEETQVVNYNEITDYIRKMDILLGNCGRKLHLSLEANEPSPKDKDIDNVAIANNIILDYIYFEKISDVSDEIKEIIIKILQDDLKTNETDFLNILTMAKEKVNKESLINGKQLKK